MSTGKKSFPRHGKLKVTKLKAAKRLNFDQRLGSNLKTSHSESKESVNEILPEINQISPVNRTLPQESVIKTSPKTPVNKTNSVNRKLFVKEWLEKNRENLSDHSNSVYLHEPCSPILSSSFTKRSSTSPIIGNSSKRSRQNLAPKNNSLEERNSAEPGPSKSKNESYFEILAENREKSAEKNEQETIRSSPGSHVSKSPILGGTILSRKLERKRLAREKRKREKETLKAGKSREVCEKFENSRKSENNTTIQNSIKPNISVTTSFPDYKSSPSIIDDETFFEETLLVKESLDLKQEEVIFEETEKEDFNLSGKIEEVNDFQLKKEIENSGDNCQVEEEIVGEIKDNDSTFIDDKTDSEETASIVIEDVDTPGLLVNLVHKEPEIEQNSESISKSSARDSEDTFFPEAESRSFENIPISQKISHVSSSNFADCRSSQNIVISQVSSKINCNNSSDVQNIATSGTSTSKPITENNVLKIEKKKRRFKKGGFTTRLQSLVSREISFLRMWKHEAKQSNSHNLNTQFFELCVKKFYNAYSRQFAECCVISDKANLLKDLFKSETEEDVNSNGVINKILTIMTVPEIVGELKLQKGVSLKVYSPWEILDRKNLILRIMRFNIHEKVSLETREEKVVKEVIPKKIERFDCPCVQQGKVVENCSLRFKNKKPNVIHEIFKSS